MRKITHENGLDWSYRWWLLPSNVGTLLSSELFPREDCKFSTTWILSSNSCRIAWTRDFPTTEVLAVAPTGVGHTKSPQHATGCWPCRSWHSHSMEFITAWFIVEWEEVFFRLQIIIWMLITIDTGLDFQHRQFWMREFDLKWEEVVNDSKSQLRLGRRQIFCKVGF